MRRPREEGEEVSDEAKKRTREEVLRDVERWANGPSFTVNFGQMDSLLHTSGK